MGKVKVYNLTTKHWQGKKHRFLIDSGFNKTLYLGIKQYRRFQEVCTKHGVQLGLQRLNFSAKTAGGTCKVLGLGDVVYALPKGCTPGRRFGYAQAIIVDDSLWKEEASPLIGTDFALSVGLSVQMGFGYADCGSWRTTPENGQYFMNIWEDLTPAALREIATCRDELNCNIQRAASTMNRRRGAENEFADESAVFKNFFEYHTARPTTLSSVYMMDCNDAELARVKAHAVEVMPTSEIIGAALKHYSGKNFNKDNLYIYARVEIGVTKAPPLRDQDKYAVGRFIHNLDEIRERHQLIGSLSKVNMFVIEQDLDLAGKDHLNLLCFYLFSSKQPGSKRLEDMSGHGVPIKSVTKNEKRLQPFIRATQTPTAIKTRRIASNDSGRQVPLALRGRTKLFLVPKDLDDLLRDGETGLSKRAQDAVAKHAKFHELAQQVQAYLTKVKTGCAMLTGAGTKACVAAAELIGRATSLRKDKMPAHFGMTSTLAAAGLRATSNGEVRKFGFGLVTASQDYYDGVSPTVTADPRKGMTRRQQNICNYLGAVARRQNNRAKPEELRLLAKTKCRGIPDEDVKNAVDAVLRTSLNNYRYQTWPFRKVQGTWQAVDVCAISQLDTTFIASVFMSSPGAVIQMIRKVTGDVRGEYVGDKYKSVSLSHMLGDERLQSFDADGNDCPELPEADKEQKGQPTAAAVIAFVSKNIEHVGRILLLDPGRENVSGDLVMMLLGCGIRVRLVATNTPRGMSDVENSHLHLKAELHAMARSPLLRELPLSASVYLCINARRERRNQTSFLESGEEFFLRGRGVPVEDDYLRYWDIDAARKSAIVRAEHRQAAAAVAAESYLDPRLHRGLEEVFARVGRREHGPQARVGDLIEHTDKNGARIPAILHSRDEKDLSWEVRNLGQVNGTTKVARKNCNTVSQSELLGGIPDSIEVYASDIPHLDIICEEIKTKGYTDRVKREGVRATCGKSKLVPCVDCHEMRYMDESFKGKAVRCVNLTPHVYCDDVSDDHMALQGLWVPERRLKDTSISAGWRKPVLEEPEEEAAVPKAVNFGGDEVVEFAVEEEDGLEHLSPRNADEAAVEDDDESEASEPGSRSVSDDDENLDEEHEEAAGGGADPDAELMRVQVDEPADADEYQVLDMEMDVFDAFTDMMMLQAHNAKIERETEQKVKPDDKERSIEWEATDAVLGFQLEKPSTALRNVISVLEKSETKGIHVETEEFQTMCQFLSTDAVSAGWAAPRWLCDEIVTVWGESRALRLIEHAQVRHERTARKFLVVDAGNGNGYCFAREAKGRRIVAAVRFEFAKRFLAREGFPDASPPMVSTHLPGMTAGYRKRLRSARKLADLMPKQALDVLNLDPYIVSALVKELTGNLIPREGESLANVLKAELEKISDRQVLSSRLILDGKYRNDVAMDVKVRWAPGGHLQEKPDEASEHASPTLGSVEFRIIACLAGRWHRVFILIFDVPRAFNISDPYPDGKEPVMRFPRSMVPRLGECFEKALGRLNSKHGTTFTAADHLLIRVPQYGLLDAAFAFFQKARSACIAQDALPSVLSPTVYRLRKEGEIVAFLGSHVDDFWVIGDETKPDIKNYVKRRMLAAFSSLRDEHFEEVGEEWKAITGKSVRLLEVEGKQVLDVSFHEKIKELPLWQADEERNGGKADPKRRLSKSEVTRLRGVRGSTGYIAEWCFDFLYQQRTFAAGADELRSVANAARINLLVRDMQEYAKQNELFLRFWLDFFDPIFILITDGSFQSRPIKVVKEDYTDKGMAELIEEGDLEKLTEAKMEQLRPMTALILLMTGKTELEAAVRELRDLRCNMLDFAVNIGQQPTTGSYGTEAVAYDIGGQSAEVTKLKFTEYATILPRGLLNEDVMRKAEKLEQYDMLDSSSVIARILSRAPGSEKDSAVFKAIARARQLQRRTNRPMIHISDVANNVDVGTKHFPGVNKKRQRLRELMKGRWAWLGGPGDRRGDAVGALRKLAQPDCQPDDKQLERDGEKPGMHDEGSVKASGDLDEQR
eukprot:g17775.t1